ncbi:hypothetical protein scyTo_0006140 [Scyliorhinus torazame]|uniref:Ig-like domain-containing protein n=1 Tax=Scyliorhinus torazame TaxID=75743 RepID=A0A401PFT2_SCYTO|nr:hypothetical protein [Scyliorhinus torazame]
MEQPRFPASSVIICIGEQKVAAGRRTGPKSQDRGASQASGRDFVEDEYIEITGITKKQAGEYQCTAYNEVSDPDVRKVEVIVNYPPFIPDTKNVGVAVGREGILQCEAAAVPPPDFEWYKEDRRLLNGLHGIQIKSNEDRSVLTFFNVSEEDYGNYTCVAVNKLGISNTSVLLFDRGAVLDGNNNASGGMTASLWLLVILFVHFLFKF